jgi:putative intracellular protease/amidase
VSEIALLLFEGLTALDAIGPYEVLQRLPGFELKTVGAAPGAVRTDTKNLALVVDHALDEVPRPAIVVVPGGFGTQQVVQDERTLAWLRAAHETSRYTTSVCTGSLILGAAGILKGLRATTHWNWMESLRALGEEPTSARVVEQGKLITAAGVSSGIDMALRLAARVAGDDVAKAIQLSIEYDPEPPFDAGSVGKAPPHVVALVREAMARRQRATA